MFKDNHKIDTFQLFALCAMMGNALFVGMGNIITVRTVQEDSWLVAPLSLLIGLIPIFLITKIMNYSPELNLVEKIKKLFGKKIGFIINILIIFIIFVILLISIWGLSIFSNTKYLTETPIVFITALFMIPILYANLKGIESIGRTSLILIFIGIVCHVIITLSLTRFSKFYNVKPILVNGISPVLMGSLRYLSYSIAPMITLLIIPKNKIKNNEKATLIMFLAYIFSTLIMAIVFYMNLSTVGINIARMYRYPEYFILKKVSLGSNLNNVENFFSVIWIYNLVVCAMMCLNYIKEYIHTTIKIKPKTENILLIILAIIVTIIPSNLFKNDTASNTFMYSKYPFFIGLSTLILLVIIFIFSIFKSKKT